MIWFHIEFNYFLDDCAHIIEESTYIELVQTCTLKLENLEATLSYIEKISSFTFIFTHNQLEINHSALEIKIVNKEAVTKQSTLLHAQSSNTYTSKCTSCLVQMTSIMFYLLQHLPSTLYLSLGQYKTIQGNISHIRCQNIKNKYQKILPLKSSNNMAKELVE